MRFLSSSGTLALVLGLFFLSSNSYSSTYSPSDSSVFVISGSQYATDALNIKAPNSAGISVNRFQTFVVDDKPLTIVNTSTSSQPNIIVIIADDITLHNTIAVVGAAADIIFLSEDSSGVIRCVQCRIENTYRASFIINKQSVSIGASSNAIGRFSSSASGRIDINGMALPGALSVDLLAGEVDTRGTISLHDRVNQSSSGGYVRHESGRYTMGSGSLNIMAGPHTWDYDAQNIIGYTPATKTSDLDGVFKAVAVRVSSAGRLPFKADIDTRTDVLSSIRYRGQPKIVEELIHLTDFTEQTFAFSSVRLNSDGPLFIKSKGQLSLPSSVTLNAPQIELLAGKTILQDAAVNGDTVDIAGDEVFNRGRIQANTILSVSAEKRLVNHQGGQLLADIVHLQADSTNGSYILNGSRKPYSSSLSVAHLPLTSDNYETDYFDAISASKVGTYYAAGYDLIAHPGSGNKLTNSKAHIRGRRIEIKTKAFENINPYYEIVDEDSRSVMLDRGLHSQVGVIAEEYLGIEAQQYIVNSSAFMGAEKSTAKVHLNTKVVTNERYRVFSTLDYSSSFVRTYNDHGGHTDGSSTVVVNKNNLQTKVAVYSPPGMLFSMGDLEAHASELFLNSIGYLEVFGDARFKTQRLVDAGIGQEQAVQSERVSTYVGSYCMSGCTSISANSLITNPDEMDSLFYVNGRAFASEANNTEITNYSPFDDYLNQVIVSLTPEKRGRGTFSGAPVWSDTYRINNSFDKDRGIITIDVKDSYSYQGPGTIVSPNYDTYQEYSIFDELKKFYDQVKDTLSSFLDEIVWWN